MCAQVSGLPSPELLQRQTAVLPAGCPLWSRLPFPLLHVLYLTAFWPWILHLQVSKRAVWCSMWHPCLLFVVPISSDTSSFCKLCDTSHHLSTPLFSHLSLLMTLAGLTRGDAAQRLKTYGTNELSSLGPEPWWSILSSCLMQPFNLVLAVLAILVGSPLPKPDFITFGIMVVSECGCACQSVT